MRCLHSTSAVTREPSMMTPSQDTKMRGSCASSGAPHNATASGMLVSSTAPISCTRMLPGLHTKRHVRVEDRVQSRLCMGCA